MGAANRDLTDPGDRSRINYKGHVHDVGRIVHYGIARDRLGEGMTERAEAVDDARLAREHGGRAGRHIVRHAGKARRQHLVSKGMPVEIAHADGAEHVERAWLDHDLDRHQGAVAGGFCRAGGSRDRALARENHAVDVNRDPTAIIAEARDRVGEAAQVLFGAPHDALAVGRSLSAEAVKGRRVLKGLQHIVIVDALDHHGVGQGARARDRQLLLRAEQAEQVEGTRGLRVGGCACQQHAHARGLTRTTGKWGAHARYATDGPTGHTDHLFL